MFRDLKMSHKLSFGFIAVILAILSMGLYLWMTLSTLERAATSNSSSNAASGLIQEASTSFAASGRAILAFAATGSDRHVAEFDAVWSKVLPSLDKATRMMPPERQDLVGKISEAEVLLHKWYDLYAVDQVERMMGQFQVGGAAEAPRRAPAHAPVPALRTAGRGGAARAPAPTADEAWEEF